MGMDYSCFICCTIDTVYLYCCCISEYCTLPVFCKYFDQLFLLFLIFFTCFISNVYILCLVVLWHSQCNAKNLKNENNPFDWL